MHRHRTICLFLAVALGFPTSSAPGAVPESSFSGGMFDALLIESGQNPVWQKVELKPGAYRALFKPSTGTSVQIDLNDDGQPELLETTWNGKRVVWIADGRTMEWGAQQGSMNTDCILVDRDNDGRFDGPGDLAVKWVDEDGDGAPDWQFISIDNARGKYGPSSGAMWMVYQNISHNHVMGYIDWKKFTVPCWEHEPPAQFLPNYNGDSLFLKLAGTVNKLNDPTLNWENPFAFYDTTGNGWTHMAIRLVDPFKPDTAAADQVKLTGTINESFVTFDVDGDACDANGMDFDFSLRFSGQGWSYTNYVRQIPKLTGLKESIALFPGNRAWRTLGNLKFVPHDKCYEELFRHQGTNCFFVFDEDDDDHRWERVELLYPSWGPEKADPWSVKRIREKDPSEVPIGISCHPQADSIGDRGEFDLDNSGKGNLYFSPLDAKLHLYGAEWGAWTTDDGTYHGGLAEPTDRPRATHATGVVIYKDVDGDGFFDTIQCDWDGDRKFEQEFSVATLRVNDRNADVQPVWDTGALGYKGIRTRFEEAVNAHWRGVVALYTACERMGVAGLMSDTAYRCQSQSQRLLRGWDLRLKAQAAIHHHLDSIEPLLPAHTKSNLVAQIDRALLLGQCAVAADIVEKLPGAINLGFANGAPESKANPARPPNPVPTEQRRQGKSITVEVRNELDSARLTETVELDWNDLKTRLPEIGTGAVGVEDSGGIELPCQAVDEDGDGVTDDLVFQCDFNPGESKRFRVLIGAVKPVAETNVFGRFVPERADDFAWENDRIGFRMYGPKLEKIQPPSSSGVDVWCKRTRQMVVNNWYKTGDYHRDHGEGADLYNVGVGRGCGGLGIWDDGKLSVSRNFHSWRVLANGPIRFVFELTYEPWTVGSERISEVKRIALDAGRNLNRFSSTFVGGPREFTVGIGINKHSVAPTVEVDPKKGYASFWGKIGSGSLGTGIVVNPASMVSTNQDQSQVLMLVKGTAGRAITYWAGAGWTLSGDFKEANDWRNYLADQARRMASPLRVSFVKSTDSP